MRMSHHGGGMQDERAALCPHANVPSHHHHHFQQCPTSSTNLTLHLFFFFYTFDDAKRMGSDTHYHKRDVTRYEQGSSQQALLDCAVDGISNLTASTRNIHLCSPPPKTMHNVASPAVALVPSSFCPQCCSQPAAACSVSCLSRL